MGRPLPILWTLLVTLVGSLTAHPDRASAAAASLGDQYDPTSVIAAVEALVGAYALQYMISDGVLADLRRAAASSSDLCQLLQGEMASIRAYGATIACLNEKGLTISAARSGSADGARSEGAASLLSDDEASSAASLARSLLDELDLVRRWARACGLSQSLPHFLSLVHPLDRPLLEAFLAAGTARRCLPHLLQPCLEADQGLRMRVETALGFYQQLQTFAFLINGVRAHDHHRRLSAVAGVTSGLGVVSRRLRDLFRH